MYGRQPILGLFFMVIGVIGVLYAVGGLLIRLALAAASLVIINHGMKLRGMAPLQQWSRELPLRRLFK